MNTENTQESTIVSLMSSMKMFSCVRDVCVPLLWKWDENHHTIHEKKHIF